MTTKICKTCNTEFAITKWQTTKVYCSARCSKGWTETTGKNKGRPKKKNAKQYIPKTTLVINKVPSKTHKDNSLPDFLFP
jgi:hypothetical protein